MGKWLCPSTRPVKQIGGGRLSSRGGTSQVPSHASQSWLFRKVCPATCIGNRVLGIMGPDLKSGEEPVVPGFGTVIHMAYTPLGGENSATGNTILSVKFMTSRPASISWM